MRHIAALIIDLISFALHNPLFVQYAVPPAGNSGSADGTGSAASFYAPSDVAIQPGTNSFVYVADSSNNMIRQVTVPGGVVTTLAGQVRRVSLLWLRALSLCADSAAPDHSSAAPRLRILFPQTCPFF